MDAREGAAHSDVVGLELCDHILSQAARAEAHAIAKVANPAPIILTHVKVVIVA